MRSARSAGQSGFTLVETMMVAAIGATLAALTLPALSAHLAKAELRDAGALLADDLRDARQLAVAHNQPVVVCARAAGDPASCAADGADWSNGWLLVRAAAQGRVAAVEPSAEVLLERRLAPADAAASTHVTRLDAPVRFAFMASGAVVRNDAAVTTVRWRLARDGAAGHWVCLTPVGRVASAPQQGC